MQIKSFLCLTFDSFYLNQAEGGFMLEFKLGSG